MPGGASYSQVGGVPSSGSRHRLVRSGGGAPNGRADTPAGSVRPGRPAARAATSRLPPIQARSVGQPAAGGSLRGAGPPARIVPSGAATASRSPPGSATAVPLPASRSFHPGQLRTAQRPGCCATRRSAPQNRSERSPAIPMVGSQDAHQLCGPVCEPIVNPSLAQAQLHLRPAMLLAATRSSRDLRGRGVLQGVRGPGWCRPHTPSCAWPAKAARWWSGRRPSSPPTSPQPSRRPRCGVSRTPSTRGRRSR
jgi:hypothetical protein